MGLQNSQSTFAKKVADVFLTKGVLFVVGLGASILSARILGPEGRGMVGTAAAIGGIGSQFMNFGMHSAGSYVLAHDKSKLSGLLGNAWIMAGFAACFGILTYGFLQVFPSLVRIRGVLLMLACAFIPMDLYVLLQQNLLIGSGNIGAYNRLELLRGISYPVLLALMALLQIVCPETMFVSTILSTLLTLACGYVFLIRRGVRPGVSVPLFRECLPFGLKSYAACLCSYLVLRSDVLMVNHMLGNEKTGFYTLAVSLSDVLCMLPTAVGMLLFPEAAAMASDFERSGFMKRTLKMVAAMMLFLTVAAALVSGFVIRLLYGEAWIPSARVFNILMPGVFFMALQSNLSNYFAAKNLWTAPILAPSCGFVSNLTANAILIPHMGIEGAAVASVLSYGLMFAIMLTAFGRDNRRVARNGREK